VRHILPPVEIGVHVTVERRTEESCFTSASSDVQEREPTRVRVLASCTSSLHTTKGDIEQVRPCGESRDELQQVHGLKFACHWPIIVRNLLT
jgi:hypothetical protein